MAVGIDPNIPEAVRKQGENADILLRQMAEGTPVKINNGEPAPDPAANDNPKPADDTGSQQDTYEQQYKVLKGKYDTEISKLRGEIDQLRTSLVQANGTISNQNDLIISMSNKIPEEQPGNDEGNPESGQAADGVKPVNAEDFEGYGEEMVTLVNANNALANENQRLKSDMKELKAKVETFGETITTSAKDRYFAALDQAVANWEEINRDPGFHTWLNEHDGLSGRTRYEILKGASEDLDASRVIKFFKTYIDETKETGPSKPDIRDEVVPDNGPGSDISPDNSIQNFNIVTREQMQDASTKFTKGRLSIEDFQKISSDFQRSIAAGKVS